MSTCHPGKYLPPVTLREKKKLTWRLEVSHGSEAKSSLSWCLGDHWVACSDPRALHEWKEVWVTHNQILLRWMQVCSMPLKIHYLCRSCVQPFGGTPSTTHHTQDVCATQLSGCGSDINNCSMMAIQSSGRYAPPSCFVSGSFGVCMREPSDARTEGTETHTDSAL